MATATKTALVPPTRIPSLKNRIELDSAIGALGSDLRELAELDGVVASEIAKVKDRYAHRREELKKTIGKRAERVTDYTDKHRHDLLEGDHKTIEFENGMIAFYFGPTAVVTDNDEAVIEECRAQGLTDAMRVVTSLDREWIEKNRDSVDIEGVTFEQTEFIKIVPVGLDDDRAIRRKVRIISCE